MPPRDSEQAKAQELWLQLDAFTTQVERVLVGQRRLIDRIVIGLLTGGHLLLEGVPGLAKTLSVRTVAQAMRLRFQRIQFTPDLLPSDVLGTQIYNPRTGEFSVKPGPIFANLILADEINRAPAKVQSALLEAMQEHQVTLGEQSHALPMPFQVLATQNPIEQEGTYPLPEAQLDRFMFKVRLDYPDKNEEFRIMERMSGVAPDLTVQPVLDPPSIQAMQNAVDQVHVDDRIKRYILDLVRATRPAEAPEKDLRHLIQFGASPRATLFLIRAARGLAFVSRRDFVTPQDVKDVLHDTLRHRLILSFEAEAEGMQPDDLITRIQEAIPAP